ncbi:hypothetical protein A1D25_07645 [Ursidibacter arcticus]|uniref:transferrin-binding protein-like solute binding protein n=1 Tax=Ursidibacter arcticus TaxID=1524965 RepID=UPI0012FC6EA2|nr:transferrin-binding protein-like solute binding protein [Ursidibacter arcticus]KAE9533722.1 hypothetical protein A1D25_07645 [Ursidibacter arcticus]
MKLSNISAMSLLSVFVLTACGGGSGGGNGNSSTSSTSSTNSTGKALNNIPENTNKAPENNHQNPETKPNDSGTEKSEPKVEDKKIEGYRLDAKRGDSGDFSWSLKGNDLNYLSVWGKKIPLIELGSEPNEKGWYSVGFNKQGLISSNQQLTYTRHGVFQPVTSNDVYIFAQGEKATEVPTMGAYNYKGQATMVYVDNNDANKILRLAEYPAEFIADFGKKELLGAISLLDQQNNVLPLTAEINGDKFKHWGGFDGVYVEGQFYGPQASELGGIYYKRDKFSGTFGAKKQEKQDK